MTKRIQEFQTIRSEGGLLPPDLLRRIIDNRQNLPGTKPEDYGLPQGERLNEVITQSWNRLCRHWSDFRSAFAKIPEGDPALGLTNDKWSLPVLRELGFGYLATTQGPMIDGRSYAINRFFGPAPIHLVGCGVNLDRRAAGVRGAAAGNPHGLVQEFLNRSEAHLWAIVSNGLRFRILRDNQALSRQSFLEFDLEAMMAGEVYSDFVLFWMMAHATRFMPTEGERQETCLLEQWTKIAEEQGTRALGDLRTGVEKALQILGEGFTSHAKNTKIREGLRSGEISRNDFHGQLLRVVYRLIFLFVAEDRRLEGLSLLHVPDDSPEAKKARERYTLYYSSARLRDMAARIKGSRHGDLWKQFQLIVRALSGDNETKALRQHLALPALGSFLWSASSTKALNDSELTNHDFLEVLRHLAFTRQGKVLRPVDYKNLGAEELGGVYESLLALTPQVSSDGARFSFAEFAGNERKTSGSYYTPDSLVQCLLDSALDPVVEEAIKGKTGKEAQKAILNLKVCDPAVGSGHFLVGAAHRLARHLSRVRAFVEGDSEPSPLLYQHALRDVIGRCLYGVDINPMSAELCRVSLWLEALEPGKPLSFLDHHIRVGNSLLGTTPELIAAGIPDEAFTAIEGDDKKACAELKKRNKVARDSKKGLFADESAEIDALFKQAAATLEELPDDRPEEIRAKELAFRKHEQTDEYRNKKLLADAWCAAFVIKKYFKEPGCESSVFGITQTELNNLAGGGSVKGEIIHDIATLASQYQFFHWHLNFPEVFANGGFDCVLGNPPWEQLEQQSSDTNNRLTFGAQHLIESCGRFPFTGNGRKNLYGLFAESTCNHLTKSAFVGLVLPTGILQDLPASNLLAELIRGKRLKSAYDFENRRKDVEGERWFRDAHPQQRFCLLTLAPNQPKSRFVFDVAGLSDLKDPRRAYSQTYDEILRFCDDAFKVPMFKQTIESRIATEAHRTGKMLGSMLRDPKQKLTSGLMFNAENTIKRQKIAAADILDHKNFVRVYEGTYIHQFDHRFATFENNSERYLSDEEKQSPFKTAITKNFLPQNLAEERIKAMTGTVVPWLHVLRRQARATDSFISISSIIPFSAVEGSLSTFIFLENQAEQSALLCATFNSFMFNFLTRLRQSGANLNKNVYSQLPIVDGTKIKNDKILFGANTFFKWCAKRVLELVYTSWDLEQFSKDVGWFAPPFIWNENRRFHIRCELDAVFFLLYLPAENYENWVNTENATDYELEQVKYDFPTPRHAVDYVMETFPIVKRKDIDRTEEQNAAGEIMREGRYITKDTILEIYDAMAEAMRTGKPYQTRLDPPPGPPTNPDGSFAQLPDWQTGQPKPANWPSHIHPPKGCYENP
ncbi:MAG: N-6 DNA methylase [Candidatus Riflebacteria bacterium]|nr:N-6 DNA methylase [Candidatus Riflebacteria bacterium]